MSIFWPSLLSGVASPIISPGYQTHFMAVILLVNTQEKALIEALIAEALSIQSMISMPDIKGGWIQMMPVEACSTELLQKNWFRIRFDALIYA